MSPWRQRDFRIVWAGGLVNDIGDWLLRVALPVFVFTETGSGASTAVVFAVELLAALVAGSFGGALVDRLDLKRVLVVTNVLQAVALLPLLAVSADRVWPAYVVAAVQAALASVNDPAKVALLPRLVPREQLTVANAANATSASLARLVGAPLGGVVVAIGGLVPVMAVDGLTFLAVAGATTLVRADTAPLGTATTSVASGAVTRAADELRAGWRALRAEPVLHRFLAVHMFAQIAQGCFVVLFVVFVVDRLGGDGADVGLIRGTMAAGALIGAVGVARWGRHVDPLRLYAAGMMGMGVTALAFWNAPAVTIAIGAYVVLFAISGLPGAALSVGFLTTLQQSSPAGYVGRVLGTFGVAEAIGMAVGSIGSGLLADRIELAWLLNTQAVIYLVAGLLAWRVGRPR